jgi:hypothetical protein
VSRAFLGIAATLAGSCGLDGDRQANLLEGTGRAGPGQARSLRCQTDSGATIDLIVDSTLAEGATTLSGDAIPPSAIPSSTCTLLGNATALTVLMWPSQGAFEGVSVSVNCDPARRRIDVTPRWFTDVGPPFSAEFPVTRGTLWLSSLDFEPGASLAGRFAVTVERPGRRAQVERSLEGAFSGIIQASPRALEESRR